MSKKLENFVKSFNCDIDEKGMDRYLFLESVSTGFQSAITVPETVLWTDEHSEEYVEEHSLSQLVKSYSILLEVAQKKLKKAVSKHITRLKGVKNISFKLKKNNLILELHADENFDDEDMVNDLECIFEGLDVTVHYLYDDN